MPERHTLSRSDEDAQRYIKLFCEFSRLELGSGGPDHHLWLIGDLARQLAPDYYAERAWLVACYMGPYNVPGGLKIWREFPVDRELDTLEDWLRANWSEIPIRKERRPARSPAKLTEYLRSARAWVFDGSWDQHDFESVWISLEKVRYVGRYAGMKFIEGMRRANAGVVAKQPDIRAHGAWSPRLALSYLLPFADQTLNRDPSAAASALAESLASGVYKALREDAGIPDIYHFEVLLCDFKQALDGHYYPGRPLDSELDQLAVAGDDRELILAARAARFPELFLGERQGWSGRRKELGATITEHGYVWSDERYDYLKTHDLAKPVARA